MCSKLQQINAVSSKAANAANAANATNATNAQKACSKPVLSVVVPVYNVEAYLEECVESLICQTLKDIELIFVNDASTDGSEDIIKEYMRRDNRIKLINHPLNKGLSAARNTGIAYAHSKYICFVDSDDFITDKNAFEYLIKLIERHGADMAAFSLYEYFGKNDQRNKIHYLCGLHLPFEFRLRADTYRASRLCAVNAWNKIFKLENIKKYNLSFPVGLKFEDLAFWLKLSLTTKPLCIVVNKPFYAYRQRGTSIMGRAYLYLADYALIVKDIYSFLKKTNNYGAVGSKLLKLLHRLCTDASVFEYGTAARQEVCSSLAEIFEALNPSPTDAFRYCGIRFFALFIDEGKVRKSYLKLVEIYRKTEYCPVLPFLPFYKLKSCFKRPNRTAEIWPWQTANEFQTEAEESDFCQKLKAEYKNRINELEQQQALDFRFYKYFINNPVIKRLYSALCEEFAQYGHKPAAFSLAAYKIQREFKRLAAQGELILKIIKSYKVGKNAK